VSLSSEEQELLRQIVEEFDDHGESSTLELLLGMDFDYILPDMETFLLDPYYMGQTGKSIYPKLLDDLIEIFEDGPFIEIHLTGGIGWGKSTIAEFIMARMIAECWVYKDPATAFGLMPGSTISFMNISVSEGQARRVIFKGLYQKLTRSPFFQECCRPDPKVVTELRFPKNLWMAPLASTDNSALGLDIWGGIMDEANFMAVVEKSKAAGRGNKRFDLAENIYYTIQRRMKSRFMEAGTIPGKLVIVSSKNYPNTFMERRMKEVRDMEEQGVFIRDYATWEPKPSRIYCGDTFPVEVGDVANVSRILTLEQAEKAHGKVIDVPVEFRKDFEKDIDQAIRDLAGVATATINPYFKDFRKITTAIDSRRHPFTAESTNLQDGAGFIQDSLVEMDPRTKKTIPRISPTEPRWVHVDPSLSGDATGIAMGHVAGLVEIERKDDDTERWTIEEAPLICIDFMLRVVPPVGGEIQFRNVRQLVYSLTEMGFLIKGVSADSYQSAESMQHYQYRGYQTARFSVEREDAYKLLKDAFYEGRVKMYEYPPVIGELRQLEFDKSSGKIDHPAGGTKDVSDAVCGVVVGLMRYMVVKSKTNFGVQVF